MKTSIHDSEHRSSTKQFYTGRYGSVMESRNQWHEALTDVFHWRHTPSGDRERWMGCTNCSPSDWQKLSSYLGYNFGHTSGYGAHWNKLWGDVTRKTNDSFNKLWLCVSKWYKLREWTNRSSARYCRASYVLPKCKDNRGSSDVNSAVTIPSPSSKITSSKNPFALDATTKNHGCERIMRCDC